MNEEHAAIRELLGAYVLGGLDPDERRQLEEHLGHCAECREELSGYAGLPGLLHRAGPPPKPVEPPESMWAELILKARTERTPAPRKRRWLLAAAAAVLLGAGALGGMAAASWSPQGADLVAAVGVTSHGHGKLEGRPWGTAVSLHLENLPPDDRFVAWVVARDGRMDQAATWSRTPTGEARLSGASSIPRDQVAKLLVTTGTGRQLLELSA
ncbi:Putative zinc-finger [Saccharopolyspora antimicrobica]|uniref:Putative zinc-finger n=1 Tax=Saccharopolyspora antimicrobica TaxID=455193 RepID=A0A1I5LV33_9PSEU|nr:zf-HC2 domain-containing protein [Saccharopolyspora antimicrobica]RKT87341.1 putative zinc finger protein [Saccharopolyspora antimicrobica]SFP00636.1 Putative zinc-finger [Saccharopolyspora antimicrobica]